MIYETLSERHLRQVDAFSCIDSPDMLANLNAKVRRRVIKHSKEMEDFLKEEALDEQELGTNTTHLLIDGEKIVAYLSLCADAIPLEVEERAEEGMTYSTSPALKLARLAVATDYQGQGIGKKMIRYAAYIADQLKEQCGIAFLTLDCYEHRVPFYEHIGFKRNQIQPIQLDYDSPVSMRLNLVEFLDSIYSE